MNLLRNHSTGSVLLIALECVTAGNYPGSELAFGVDFGTGHIKAYKTKPVRANEPDTSAWYVAFGRAVDEHGEDLYGAGAIRFDSKVWTPGGEPWIPRGSTTSCAW